MLGILKKWHKKIIKQTLVIIAILAMGAHSYGSSNAIGTTAMDFTKLGISVKSAAIGEALVAGMGLAAEPLNPASIAGIDQIAVDVQYISYFADMGYKSVSAAIPTPLGSFGLRLGLMDYGTQTRTTYLDRSGEGNESISNSAYNINGTYAIAVKSNWSMGFGLSYSEQTLDQVKGHSLGASIGTRYEITSNLSTGFSIANMTLQRAKYDADEALLPQTARWGILYETQMMDSPLNLAADMALPNDDAAFYGMGCEYTLAKILHLRLGYSSYSQFGNLSCGLGLDMGCTVLDFAYKPSELMGQSYRIGFGIRL